MMNKQGEASKLRELQETGFVLHELVLYLDTHPDNRKALNMYRTVRKKYMDLYAQYEAEHGPMTARGVIGDRWTWGAMRWPWQQGGNGHVDV